MPEAVLGISAYYHDSAAALVVDGRIVAAAHEERFTRSKHDSSFPGNAVAYVLAEAGLGLDDLSSVAFYDKPYLKFERLLETSHAYAPTGLASFLVAMPVWLKEKLFTRKLLRNELLKFGTKPPKILFPEHHLSHAASAFFPSPYTESAILTVDGVGEWATTTIGIGKGSEICVLRELDFPHSLGLLYSAFTHYCGFRVNSGEYKLMGLAPFGNSESEETIRCKKLILDELVDLRADGSFLLNMHYFNFAAGLTMCHDAAWKELFGFGRREPESPLKQEQMDMALAIQQVTEEIILLLAKTAAELTGSKNLVMAGGVALNCVANGRLYRERIFDNIWIQPAAGDAGGALGAALAAWHIGRDKPRVADNRQDAMQGGYLGPEYGSIEILRMARRYQATYRHYPEGSALCDDVAGLLAEGNVIGWFQGRMEFGPRALGNRSILGDPRNPAMQKRLNLKIKFREGFRPFAPSVLAEDCAEYFELADASPYMLLCAPVVAGRRNPMPEGHAVAGIFERLYHLRSDIPAVTHVDYSSRIQTVHCETNERYWQLITAFKSRTGYGLLVNTSFNVRGEPIVCSPDDAFRCFMSTDMDYLVIGDYLFNRKQQQNIADDKFSDVTFPMD